jgi:hypothetical protein
MRHACRNRNPDQQHDPRHPQLIEGRVHSHITPPAPTSASKGNSGIM